MFCLSWNFKVWPDFAILWHFLFILAAKSNILVSRQDIYVILKALFVTRNAKLSKNMPKKNNKIYEKVEKVGKV